MAKEILQVEFRYRKIPKGEFDHSYVFGNEITVGIYDTLAEACAEGNKVLSKLSKNFKFRDTFGTNNGVFGSATRLVTNYDKTKVEVFVKITSLKFDDLESEMEKALTSQREFEKWDND